MFWFYTFWVLFLIVAILLFRFYKHKIQKDFWLSNLEFWVYVNSKDVIKDLWYSDYESHKEGLKVVEYIRGKYDKSTTFEEKYILTSND